MDVQNVVLSICSFPLKVVDSCRIISTKWSDTFRIFFVYLKEQESRKIMS